MSAPEPLPNRADNHGYRGRVRTGCVTCRSRKVRCDEQKPVCNNCSKGRRQCVYKPRKSREIVRKETSQIEIPPVNVLATRNIRHDVATGSSPSNLDDLPLNEHCDALPNASPSGPTSLLGRIPIHNHLQTPDSPAIDIIARVESAIQHQHGDPFTITVSEIDDSSPSALISRDIRLCTTMDILAAGEIPWKPWITFFVEEVEFPIITPYDSINWRRAKFEIVGLGTSAPVVASAVIALAALYKGQLHGLPLSRAMFLYYSAKDAYERLLLGRESSFGIILTTVFLLSLFNYIQYDSNHILMEQHAIFKQKLGAWLLDKGSHCNLSLRLIAWLRLLQVAATRGGGTGLVPEEVSTLLSTVDSKIPDLKPASNESPDTGSNLFEMLNTPVFDFYFQLQMLSADLTKLTHYRRSRVTGADQEEVVQQIIQIKLRLDTLWENRAPIQRQDPKDLRSYLAPPIADPLITLIGICAAAYHAEIIEMNRILGDRALESTEATNAMRAVREIVDGDYNAYDDNKLHAGYLRPLFLYIIECMDREKTDWAVRKLEDIQNPICRSQFFAAFGKALSEAQLLKDRRVTSKYFAIWYFGVPPPFM